MTDEQKYKLQKVIEIVTDSLNDFQNTSSKNTAIYLSVARDYCDEVAKEISEKKIK